MKWFSWFRRNTPEADTVVMPASAARPSGRPAGPQPRRVDWEKIDQAGEGEDPFATRQLELQSDQDQAQETGSRRRDKPAYNPYDTGAFTTGIDRAPDLHRDRSGRPTRPEPRKKTAYNPYDTSTFHGSWNRNSR